ncbi:hypothetical protein BC628DRAFT_992726 [Trametes gibbosa]|nr:hypothetical protein BC628DRAFT_992726 [Trametes gibbosa]
MGAYDGGVECVWYLWVETRSFVRLARCGVRHVFMWTGRIQAYLFHPHIDSTSCTGLYLVNSALRALLPRAQPQPALSMLSLVSCCFPIRYPDVPPQRTLDCARTWSNVMLTILSLIFGLHLLSLGKGSGFCCCNVPSHSCRCAILPSRHIFVLHCPPTRTFPLVLRRTRSVTHRFFARNLPYSFTHDTNDRSTLGHLLIYCVPQPRAAFNHRDTCSRGVGLLAVVYHRFWHWSSASQLKRLVCTQTASVLDACVKEIMHMVLDGCYVVHIY